MTAIPDDIMETARSSLMVAITVARSKSADDAVAIIARAITGGAIE